jgi:hypothetical protein
MWPLSRPQIIGLFTLEPARSVQAKYAQVKENHCSFTDHCYTLALSKGAHLWLPIISFVPEW